MTHYKEVRELMRNVSALSADEVFDEYYILMKPNGRVFDTFYKVTYDSLQAWAEAQFEDPGQEIEHPHHGW